MNLNQAEVCQLFEQIEIPQYQVALGDDGQWMAPFKQQLEYFPGNPKFFLCRLVRVRVGTQGDRLNLVAAVGEF